MSGSWPRPVPNECTLNSQVCTRLGRSWAQSRATVRLQGWKWLQPSRRSSYAVLLKRYPEGRSTSYRASLLQTRNPATWSVPVSDHLCSLSHRNLGLQPVASHTDKAQHSQNRESEVQVIPQEHSGFRERHLPPFSLGISLRPNCQFTIFQQCLRRANVPGACNYNYIPSPTFHVKTQGHSLTPGGVCGRAAADNSDRSLPPRVKSPAQLPKGTTQQEKGQSPWLPLQVLRNPANCTPWPCVPGRLCPLWAEGTAF